MEFNHKIVFIAEMRVWLKCFEVHVHTVVSKALGKIQMNSKLRNTFLILDILFIRYDVNIRCLVFILFDSFWSHVNDAFH